MLLMLCCWAGGEAHRAQEAPCIDDRHALQRICCRHPAAAVCAGAVFAEGPGWQGTARQAAEGASSITPFCWSVVGMLLLQLFLFFRVFCCDLI
jgi:hypothetical protein